MHDRTDKKRYNEQPKASEPTRGAETTVFLGAITTNEELRSMGNALHEFFSILRRWAREEERGS